MRRLSALIPSSVHHAVLSVKVVLQLAALSMPILPFFQNSSKAYPQRCLLESIAYILFTKRGKRDAVGMAHHGIRGDESDLHSENVLGYISALSLDITHQRFYSPITFFTAYDIPHSQETGCAEKSIFIRVGPSLRLLMDSTIVDI